MERGGKVAGKGAGPPGGTCHMFPSCTGFLAFQHVVRAVMLCVLGTEGGRFAQLWEDPSARAYSPLIPQTPMKGWPECLLTIGQFCWDRTGATHNCHRASSPQSCQQG